MRTVSISEFYNVSREEDEVVPPVEESTSEPVETSEVSDTTDTSVAFDTTGSDTAELPAEDIAEVTEDLGEATTEANAAMDEQAEIADVHQELSEEVPVMEAKLENPETITPQDAMLATESLKYKLKRVNIPLNNSRALAGLTAESVMRSPAEVFQIALEDEKTLMQKAGDVLAKAWEWIKKQFSRIWEFIKRIFGNTEAKLRKMKEDLKGKENQEGRISTKQLENIFKKYTLFSHCHGPDKGSTPLAIVKGNIHAMKAVKEFVYKYKAAAAKKETQPLVDEVVAFIKELNNTPLPEGIKEVFDKVQNKDYQYKAIGWYSAKKATIIFFNPKTDGGQLDIAFEPIDIPVNTKSTIEPSDYVISGSDLIKGVDVALELYSAFDKLLVDLNKNLQQSPVLETNSESGKVSTWIANKLLNRAVIGVAHDGMSCIEANARINLAFGDYLLKGEGGKDTK